MCDHNLFYYPYASLTNEQLPLLKVAALYFDKLFILDPVGASWGRIGADHFARVAVKELVGEGLLTIVTPAEVLENHEKAIGEAIRRDMQDREFLELCDAHSRTTRKERWTLALAKVPKQTLTDQAMRHLMGDLARDAAHKAAYAIEDFVEHAQALASLPGNDVPVPDHLLELAATHRRYYKSGSTYDEYREGYDSDVEYRYADFPLALGEAIMMNHALFAGLVHSSATPVTDNPFHSQALALKLRRAVAEPDVRQVIADRSRKPQAKAGPFAFEALTSSRFQLPILDPSVPLGAVLEYRKFNSDSLARVRHTLGRMARQVRSEPWSDEFAKELEAHAIPELTDQLEDTARKRDEWLAAQRSKGWYKGGGILVGIASAILTLVTAPVTPVAVTVAGLALVGGATIPGLEWFSDWRSGKKSHEENGLHYLLET
jgi:hypothetical protein